jgi:hypothetical protein
MPNSQAGGPPLVSCPRLLSQYIRSFPPYREGVSSIRNLRTRHAMVTRDPPNVGWSIPCFCYMFLFCQPVGIAEQDFLAWHSSLAYHVYCVFSVACGYTWGAVDVLAAGLGSEVRLWGLTQSKMFSTPNRNISQVHLACDVSAYQELSWWVWLTQGNTDLCLEDLRFFWQWLNISVCWDGTLRRLPPVFISKCAVMKWLQMCTPLWPWHWCPTMYWALPEFYTNPLKPVMSVYVLQMGSTVKFIIYDPGYYVFHRFTRFLHGPGQMPITVMLNFNRFYVSLIPCFPSICTSFF